MILVYSDYSIRLVVSSITSAVIFIKIPFELVVFFIVHAADFVCEPEIKSSASEAAATPDAKSSKANDETDEQDKQKTAQNKKRQKEQRCAR